MYIGSLVPRLPTFLLMVKIKGNKLYHDTCLYVIVHLKAIPIEIKSLFIVYKKAVSAKDSLKCRIKLLLKKKESLGTRPCIGM